MATKLGLALKFRLYRSFVWAVRRSWGRWCLRLRQNFGESSKGGTPSKFVPLMEVIIVVSAVQSFGLAANYLKRRPTVLMDAMTSIQRLNVEIAAQRRVFTLMKDSVWWNISMVG
jgi:hypothetical protein